MGIDEGGGYHGAAGLDANFTGGEVIVLQNGDPATFYAQVDHLAGAVEPGMVYGEIHNCSRRECRPYGGEAAVAEEDRYR